MNLAQLISFVDGIKPNGFTNEQKTIWVNDLESRVQTEVFLLSAADIYSYVYQASSTVNGVLFPDSATIRFASDPGLRKYGLLTITDLTGSFAGNNITAAKILDISADGKTLTFAAGTFANTSTTVTASGGTYAFDGSQVELLADAAHQKIYWSYLAAMIDFANGEYGKFNNALTIFSDFFGEYSRWYAKKYRPGNGLAEEKGYYLSAYAIAVKHGYGGTEDEWLLTLKGDQGNGLVILDLYATLAGLQAAHATGNAKGDCYAVGTAASNVIYAWNGTEFKNYGPFKGEKGDTGAQGIQGVKGDTGATGAKGETGNGISYIVRTSGIGAGGTTDTYTITYTNNTTSTFTVYNGLNGTSAYIFAGSAVTGTGTGINAAVTGSKAGDLYLNSSTSNVYTATAANTWDYVCNIKGNTGATGAAGAAGISAYVHIKWGTSSTPDTLLDAPNQYIGIYAGTSATAPASYTGYSWYRYKGEQGIQGEQGVQGVQGQQGIQGTQGVKGDTGNGIASVARTSGSGTAGTTDTYTITFTDATTATFTVYNGADGQGSGDMLKSAYDTDNDGIVDNAEALGGQAGSYYLDRANHTGTQSADTITDGTTNKAYTATEQTKLAGIAEGATVGKLLTNGNGYALDNGSVRPTLGYWAVDLSYTTYNGAYGATGGKSFCEGGDTIASGSYSHAEGLWSVASGSYSHAEGRSTASNASAHAEGEWTTASGFGSHSEGDNSEASGNASHAEGYACEASAEGSHAEGNGSYADGAASHAEGDGCNAEGAASHAEGYRTDAYGDASHAEGYYTTANTNYSHAEGQYSLACNGTLYKITAYNNTAKTITLDNVTGLAVSDLLQIKTANAAAYEDIPISAINGLVVTLNTTLTITSSWKHAIEKYSTTYPVHTEGYNTTASGNHSHAEGSDTVASGNYSHAEGQNTTANSTYSHAEGDTTTASGAASHAEGASSTASGSRSHAQNRGTVAQGMSQTAIGEYNTVQGTANSRVSTDYAFIIGNGADSVSRSNALTVDWAGNLVAAGNVTANGKVLNTIIAANANASPALGTLAHNNEYRCTNTSLTTAPTMTIAAIASTSTEFACVVIFKAPNTTVPIVTNNSGYTLKYSGQDVSSGVWTPVAGTVYRMSFVFDGIYLNVYISGVV